MKDIQGLPLNVRQWLNQRGITDNIIVSYNIGWTGEMISIPITKNGKVLFKKYRRDPFTLEGPKYIYDKGASVELFGLDSLNGYQDIILCEGEFDAMALIAKQFSAVSGTGGAMTFKEEWIDQFKGMQVYICFDNDRAGIDGAIRIHKIFQRAKIMVLPQEIGEHGDVTDFFVKLYKTSDDFKDLMRAARQFLPFPDPQDLRKDKNLLQIFKDYANRLLGEQRILRCKGKDTSLLSSFLNEYVRLLDESKLAPKTPYTGGSDRLHQAKAVSIKNYLDFNRTGFRKCIWHDEKTASMKYSEKQNRVYCFGCSRNGDVIDVIQNQRGVNLPEALKLILNDNG